MLSRLEFSSFLAYSPRGASEVSRRSQSILRSIKRDEVDPNPNVGSLIAFAVRRLLEAKPSFLGEFLGPEVILVPVPGSAPTGVNDALWVARRICEELLKQGLGAARLESLERVHRVPKSAWSSPDSRPTPEEHFESLRARRELYSPLCVTLVDDVVTQGSTALAAASRLTEAFPSVEVRLFALVRTRGLVSEIDSIVDPVAGTIELRNGRAWRDQP